MRWIPIVLFSALFSSAASAQTVTVDVGLPVIRWEAPPPLVVVSPGLWVVEDSPDEIFYYNQWYWTAQGGRWYRSRDHHGHWLAIEPGRVPGRFHVREPGHYRHFHRDGGPRQGHVGPERGHVGPGTGPAPRRVDPVRSPERQDARHGDSVRGAKKPVAKRPAAKHGDRGKPRGRH